MAGTFLAVAAQLVLTATAHARQPPGRTLPELVRRDGVFCAPVIPPRTNLCDAVIRITRVNLQEAWITYTGLVKAHNNQPAIKMRLGTFGTIRGDEVCIQADTARLTLELFEAMDDRIGIAPEEKPMDALAASRRKKIERPIDRPTDDSVTCRGLTKSGHLLTFGSHPQPMRFIPLADAGRLRLRAYGGGL